MALTLSANLRAILNQMQTPLAHTLLQTYIPRPEINFVDIAKDDDKIRFSYLPEKNSGYNAYPDIWDKNAAGRVFAKPAKVLGKLLPNLKEDDLRSFVEELQAKNDTANFDVKVVRGKEIIDLISLPVTQLSKNVVKGTKIYSSCFQGKLSEKSLAGFALPENEENIEMLTVWYEDKLDSRAFLLHGINLADDSPRTIVSNIQYGAMGAYYIMQDFADKAGYIFPHLNTGLYHQHGEVATRFDFKLILKSWDFPNYFDGIYVNKIKTADGPIVEVTTRIN